MDVNNWKPMDRVQVTGANTSGASSAASGTALKVSAQSTEIKSEIKNEESRVGDKKDLSHDELLPITKELNKFMTYLNADIQFSLHEKTQRLVVKVVDTKENKVLREFPPEELLDTIANIREYVGVLLDKKA